MASTVQPILVTPDLNRLLTFYVSVLGAVETTRFPESGTIFYVGLRIGDSDIGLTADADVDVDSPGRILLSVDVVDVDALLRRVEALGGRVQGPANDMPWRQRVAHIADPDGNVVNLTQQL
jgi:predicted enzyme related to lactoylglutathione lyase